MDSATIIFPHQLFKNSPALHKSRHVFLIEDQLYFGNDSEFPVNNHAQKLLHLRASMKEFESLLIDEGYEVTYIEASDADLVSVYDKFFADSSTLHIVDTIDFLLQKRLKELSIDIEWYESPNFLNSVEVNAEYSSDHKAWQMQYFYKFQRKRLNILLDEDGEPTGGKWSFDESNRKKVPKNEVSSLETLRPIDESSTVKEARKYVKDSFPNAIGSCDAVYFPTTHTDAKKWLQTFFEQRFAHFGPYEDAIEQDVDLLFHSAITPMLNIGLLTPREVIDDCLEYADSHSIPIESLEGFIRQIIGWREFMRATYEDLGVKMRTHNHWDHTNDMPTAFYDGSTGLLPVDNCIKRILKTGYCHHIERLMVLGGCMFLCEIHPKQIYKWFMEMFIDSYDWVMVTNVYAMSQNSSGGLITTKPYFSGSAYIKKMSHYADGEWSEIWDSLYWSFIHKHSSTLSNNPRWAMMCSQVKKMNDEKIKKYTETKDQFFEKIFT